MNKKTLALRLALMAAAGISVAAFIKADDPRLLTATFPGAPEEIILRASAWVLPDNYPEHVIATEKALTWEFIQAPMREGKPFVFISSKAPDPLGDAKVVTWSYDREHQYGCLELYPSLNVFHSNPRWEILAGVCRPLSLEQSVFSMDSAALMTALNFAANSYILLMESKLAGQGVQSEAERLPIEGVQRLEKARAVILASIDEHASHLRLIFGAIAFALVMNIIYGLHALYTLDHGP